MGINCELFFLKNNKYYKLKIFDNNFQSLFNLTDNVTVINSKLNEFFYTLIINYSIYSFNPVVLSKNDGFHNSSNFWIEGLFHKNDSYQIPVVINPKRESIYDNFGGCIDINNEQELVQQRLLFNILKYYENGYDEHLKITENRKAVTLLKDNKLYSTLNTFESINQNEIEIVENNIKGEKLNAFWKNSFRNPISYGIQINGQVIDKKPKTYWQYDQVILKTLLKFGIKEKRNPFVGKCYEYIVYKIYSICEKYPDYKKYLKYVDNDIRKITINIDGFLEYIFELKNRSHITNKLMQVINFINYYDKIWLKYINTETIEITQLAKELNGLVNKEHPLIEMLPPPIFYIKIEVDEFINNKYQNNKITVDKLSSGEQQLIHSTSTIFYHLNNLKSVKKTGLITKYDSINLIFDEIELYFHPEYQRQLLLNILKGLKNNKLDTLKINILFVTHSPFILSDIPSQNILKLEDGNLIDNSVSENTFGANIHDLLANDFFLKNGFMGEFAKSEINKVIDFLNNEKINNKIEQIEKAKSSLKKIDEINKIDEELKKLKGVKKLNQFLPDSKVDKDYCKKIIEIVGEPMLSSSLMELYTEAYTSEKENFIKQQIARLQKLI